MRFPKRMTSKHLARRIGGRLNGHRGKVAAAAAGVVVAAAAGVAAVRLLKTRD